MGLCHTAAILSRVTQIALVYLPSLSPKGGKTKLFQSLGRRVKKRPIEYMKRWTFESIRSDLSNLGQTMI